MNVPVDRSVPFNPGLGFADPVHDAQRVFRGLMRALSLPGQQITLPLLAFEGTVGLMPATAAALLTMCDQDSLVWLEGGSHHAASRWLAFHANARITNVPPAAAFAVLDGMRAHGFAAFAQGEDRYPDRSATLFVECTALTGGPVARLTGPGIDGTLECAPQGLHADFWPEIAANGARFPLGVDVVLVCGATLVGLPRTVRVSALAEAA